MNQSQSKTNAALIKEAVDLLKNQQVLAAEERLDALLARVPTYSKALFYKAVCLRTQGRHRQAIHHLKKALELIPDFGRAWQEIGHNHRDQQKPTDAIQAYRRAVELNPGLLASWRELGAMLTQQGHMAEAQVAQANFSRLSQLPKLLQAVTSLMHEGKLYKAEQLCRQHLKAHPKDVEGMRLLATMGMKLNVLDDAEFLLESALAFEPGFDLARLDYITVLHRRQKFQKAFDQAKELRRRLPNNLSAEMAYANQLAAVGKYESALGVLDELLAHSPNPSNIQMQRGHALKTIGQSNQAIAAYQAAAEQRPSFGDAWWSLANMKTHHFSDRDIEQMERALESEAASSVDIYHLHFALGKAWEDRQAFEASFENYAKGNALKQKEVRYRPEQMQQECQRQKDFFTPRRVDTFAGLGCQAADPIFIVGLPRAGSTLIEQILASHPSIDGTLELPHILATAHRLSGRQLVGETPKYPTSMETLTASEIEDLGIRYLDETRIHRQGAPYFTDKMPNNFRHIGLIKTILPNAKIIDARRHPMAGCFGGFKQLFAEGQEFSYCLENIGRYYVDYVDLMNHWHAVYPDQILQLDYEQVVDDLEGQVARLLDFLGLPFDDACVAFHQTKRSVRTASAGQVRQPIYQSGLTQWRHFEPWLGPLKASLAPLRSMGMAL